MGKRELVLIVAFAVIGTIAYRLTAPAAASGSGFSIAKLVEHVRAHVRGQNHALVFARKVMTPVGEDVRRVNVHAGRGKITIVGEEREDVVTEVNGSVFGTDEPEARALADAITVTAEAEGDAIDVRLKLPERMRRRPRLDIRMLVPSHLTVSLGVQGGDLEVKNVAGVQFDRFGGKAVLQAIDGAVTGEMSGGWLEVTRAAAVDLDTERIEIRLSDISGAVTLEADRGDIRIRKVGGGVTLKLERAEVEVEEVRGPLKAEGEFGSLRVRTVGGPVEIQGERLQLILEPGTAVPLQAATEGEHIELALPEEGAELQATATGGEIRSTNSSVQIETTPEEQRARATIGGGGPLMKLSIKGGDIVIR